MGLLLTQEFQKHLEFLFTPRLSYLEPGSRDIFYFRGKKLAVSEDRTHCPMQLNDARSENKLKYQGAMKKYVSKYENISGKKAFRDKKYPYCS